jgi:DNA repair exonuclease SbcCD ATPase subunit
MEGLDKEYQENKERDDIHSTEITSIVMEMKPILSDITRLEKEVEKWNNTKGVDGVECPTCFQKVDPEHIKSHIEEKITELTRDIKSLHTTYDIYSDKALDLTKTRDEFRAKCLELKDKLDKKSQLEKKLITLSNIDDKEKELLELIGEKESAELKLSALRIRHNALINEIKDEDDKIKDLSLKESELRSDINNLTKSIETHNREIFEYETLLNSYNEKKEIVDKLELEYQVKVASKSQLEKEVAELKQSTGKKSALKDYLTYIKETLKDDNTKQYAISNIIPYITQRSNYYLSETGHNYYIQLDNFLEGEILGQGVGECDFGNMSAGEGRIIDMAMKFAFMDVARRQAGSYLDILVLDELLDSSVDSMGLESLMSIIKTKQREDDLKVYIISHREEIGEFGIDNTYKVTKHNGFSNMTEVMG